MAVNRKKFWHPTVEGILYVLLLTSHQQRRPLAPDVGKWMRRSVGRSKIVNRETLWYLIMGGVIESMLLTGRNFGSCRWEEKEFNYVCQNVVNKKKIWYPNVRRIIKSLSVNDRQQVGFQEQKKNIREVFKNLTVGKEMSQNVDRSRVINKKISE